MTALAEAEGSAGGAQNSASSNGEGGSAAFSPQGLKVGSAAGTSTWFVSRRVQAAKIQNVACSWQAAGCWGLGRMLQREPSHNAATRRSLGRHVQTASSGERKHCVRSRKRRGNVCLKPASGGASPAAPFEARPGEPSPCLLFTPLLSQVHVLVVDDDPMCLKVVSAMLQRCNYEGTCGGSAGAGGGRQPAALLGMRTILGSHWAAPACQWQALLH